MKVAMFDILKLIYTNHIKNYWKICVLSAIHGVVFGSSLFRHLLYSNGFIATSSWKKTMRGYMLVFIKKRKK